MSTSALRAGRIREVWDAAWDRGDVDAFDDLLGPDYRRIGSSGDAQDRAAFKDSIVATRAAFPSLVTTIDDIVEDGDRVAIRWHSTGVHQNSFLGVPATRREVTVSGATFARFADDVIVEEHVTWDPRALLAALGIISIGQDQ
ncbi:ester cyclase [Gordonia polyisoprenivorans]|uniref:ester cyclase n=1 Tax=Gordonia polyisoprenivorans TaxID=84595 RepID=UPI001B8C7BB0|nr:ester cyclase [Gordonia polyisoprenivorans]QUD83215.1 ester cyclase [Gordonia polyisoprenivorans]